MNKCLPFHVSKTVLNIINWGNTYNSNVKKQQWLMGRLKWLEDFYIISSDNISFEMGPFYYDELMLEPYYSSLFVIICIRLSRYKRNPAHHIKAVNISNQSNQMTKFKPTQAQMSREDVTQLLNLHLNHIHILVCSEACY